MMIKSTVYNNNMQQYRFDKMRQLSILLKEQLTQLDHWKLNSNDAFSPLDFVEQRIEKLPLRAFFVKQLFDLLYQELKWSQKASLLFAKKNDDFTVKLPFVFEVIISIQYLHNQILDQKAGVDHPQQINNNLLQANMLKDMLFEYIDNNFDIQAAHLIRKAARQSFVLVDFGQQLEKKYGTIEQFSQATSFSSPNIPQPIEQQIDLSSIQEVLDNIQKEIPLNYWDFTLTYIKRVFLTCGALFKISAELIADLLGIEGETKKQLSDFATSYGIMRQIINDNADFAPTQLGLTATGKLATDAFSDLKNNNITLPVILHLANTKKSNITQYIGQRDLLQKNEVQQEIANELRLSTAWFTSVWIARHFAAIAQRFLPQNNEAAALLSNTCDIAYWNKFLSPVTKTKAYKQFKKSSQYHQLAVIEQQLQLNPTPITIAESHPPALVNQLLFNW